MTDTSKYRADSFLQIGQDNFRWNEGNRSWDETFHPSNFKSEQTVEYAELDGKGFVVFLTILDERRAKDEAAGIAYCKSLFGAETTWAESGRARNRAEIGRYLDTKLNLFLYPSPYPSWKLDENYNWQPPVPMPPPKDGVYYRWDEEKQSWYESDTNLV